MRIQSRILIAAFSAVTAVSGLAAAEGPWQRNDQSALRLITPYEVAPRQGEFRFGVEFELAPHWHVYWANSGDAGYPPALDLGATPQVSEPELLFPAPERFHLPGGLLAFGYEDAVIYPVRASISAEGEHLELAVNVDYVVCEVECIPYNYDLTLTQPIGDPVEDPVEDPAQAERLASWLGRVPAAGSDLAAAIEIDDAGNGRIDVALPLAARDLFFLPQDTLILGEPSILPAAGGSHAQITVSRLDVGKALPIAVDLEWTATAEAGDAAFPGQSGTLLLAVPAAWQSVATAAQADASAAPTSGSMWWYWLPVVLAAGCLLASGAVTAPPAVLRGAWIGGVLSASVGWYLASGGEPLVSMSVVAAGSWLLILGAVAAFAGSSFRGGLAMAMIAAAATVGVLPAAPGIGWVGAALLVLVVIGARPRAESPSRTWLGLAGFLALLGVITRFYLLSGSVPPTPLAGIQLGLLSTAAGGWTALRAAKAVSRAIGWVLIIGGAACLLYFS